MQELCMAWQLLLVVVFQTKTMTYNNGVFGQKCAEWGSESGKFCERGVTLPSENPLVPPPRPAAGCHPAPPPLSCWFQDLSTRTNEATWHQWNKKVPYLQAILASGMPSCCRWTKLLSM